MIDDEEPERGAIDDWDEQYPNDGGFEYKMIPGTVSAFYRRRPQLLIPATEWEWTSREQYQRAMLPCHQRGDE